MATITPAAKGGNLTFTSASTSDTLDGTVGKNYRYYITNGADSAVTATFAGVEPCSQGYVHASTGAPSVSCAAGKTTIFDIPVICQDQTTGNIAVALSSATSVTVAAIER